MQKTTEKGYVGINLFLQAAERLSSVGVSSLEDLWLNVALEECDDDYYDCGIVAEYRPRAAWYFGRGAADDRRAQKNIRQLFKAMLSQIKRSHPFFSHLKLTEKNSRVRDWSIGNQFHWYKTYVVVLSFRVLGDGKPAVPTPYCFRYKYHDLRQFQPTTS